MHLAQDDTIHGTAARSGRRFDDIFEYTAKHPTPAMQLCSIAGAPTRRLGQKQRRSSHAAAAASSCSEAEGDSDQTQMREPEGGEWQLPAQRHARQRLRHCSAYDDEAEQPRIGLGSPLRCLFTPRAEDVQPPGQLQQPEVGMGTAALLLSPLFPGLVLHGGGITPGCDAALDPAAGCGGRQRARSLPGGSPCRSADAAGRPARLMHFDSVGLVRQPLAMFLHTCAAPVWVLCTAFKLPAGSMTFIKGQTQDHHR